MSQASESTLQATGLSAGLTVNDLDRSIRFYQTLGFEVEERWESEGTLVGVMVRAGGVHLALNQDDWKKGRDRLKGAGIRFWIGTDQDLDPLAERARNAGISEARPYHTPWGSRVLDLTDPDGFALTFSNGH